MMLTLKCPCGGVFDADDTADGSWTHSSLIREADKWREAHAVCLRPLAVREAALPTPTWEDDAPSGEPSR